MPHLSCCSQCNTKNVLVNHCALLRCTARSSSVIGMQFQLALFVLIPAHPRVVLCQIINQTLIASMHEPHFKSVLDHSLSQRHLL
jgi:hypothetical protein